MKADIAERLAECALRMSEDLNEMVRDIEASEPEEESARLRRAIGRVMWAIYYEILKPTFEEHTSLESDMRTKRRRRRRVASRPPRRRVPDG